MKHTLFILLSISLILTSCGTYSDDDLKKFDSEIQSYIKKKNLDLKPSGSGLYFKITEEGEGDFIQYNDIVSFTYTGTLLNGEQFDKQSSPVEFKVNQLIGAWKEIMSSLKKGGKATLIAPPQLCYGDKELDDIPENSILIFEMEVKDVK